MVSSVIAGAGNQKIKHYFLFLNEDKDTLTMLIEALIGHYECELGVMYPFWMSGQTQHPPPTCCFLDEPELSPLQTAARASLPEQLSPAPRSSLTSAKKKKKKQPKMYVVQAKVSIAKKPASFFMEENFGCLHYLNLFYSLQN